MADDSAIQITEASDLGVDAPVPRALRERLASDLCQAQCLALSIGELTHGMFDGGDAEHERGARLTAIDAMSYRIGKLLEPWAATGFYGDDKERRVELV